ARGGRVRQGTSRESSRSVIAHSSVKRGPRVSIPTTVARPFPRRNRAPELASAARPAPAHGRRAPAPVRNVKHSVRHTTHAGRAEALAIPGRRVSGKLDVSEGLDTRLSGALDAPAGWPGRAARGDALRRKVGKFLPPQTLSRLQLTATTVSALDFPFSHRGC